MLGNVKQNMGLMDSLSTLGSPSKNGGTSTDVQSLLSSPTDMNNSDLTSLLSMPQSGTLPVESLLGAGKDNGMTSKDIIHEVFSFVGDIMKFVLSKSNDKTTNESNVNTQDYSSLSDNSDPLLSNFSLGKTDQNPGTNSLYPMKTLDNNAENLTSSPLNSESMENNSETSDGLQDVLDSNTDTSKTDFSKLLSMPPAGQLETKTQSSNSDGDSKDNGLNLKEFMHELFSFFTDIIKFIVNNGNGNGKKTNESNASPDQLDPSLSFDNLDAMLSDDSSKETDKSSETNSVASTVEPDGGVKSEINLSL